MGQIRNSKTLKILKPYIGIRGYFRIGLNRKQYSVHRLVAEAYLENTCGLPAVNDKNSNRLCNIVGNLEWVTHAENNRYRKPFRRSNTKGSSRPIWCCLPVSDPGEQKQHIWLYPSVKAAARSFSKSRTASNSICRAVRGYKIKSGDVCYRAYGFSWEHASIQPIKGETWTPIDPLYVRGTTGYHVSSEGRVRSRRGYLLKTSGTQNEYPWVSIASHNYLLHRIVALCLVDNPQGKPIVHHIDNDKRNFHPSNLE